MLCYRKWTLYLTLLLLPLVAQAKMYVNFPQPTPGVQLYDYAETLTRHERLYIESMLENMLIDTDYRLFVVIIDDIPEIGTAKDIARLIFEQWKLTPYRLGTSTPLPQDVLMLYMRSNQASHVSTSTMTRRTSAGYLHHFEFEPVHPERPHNHILQNREHSEIIINNVEQLAQAMTEHRLDQKHTLTLDQIIAPFLGLMFLGLMFVTASSNGKQKEE
ncbi:MAG: TPM domain-containing protein [Marinobacterium sp.]|nr:TPM domain-containing protein [Marinobacterium sp.]